jgi:hypothetical protein
MCNGHQKARLKRITARLGHRGEWQIGLNKSDFIGKRKEQSKSAKIALLAEKKKTPLSCLD